MLRNPHGDEPDGWRGQIEPYKRTARDVFGRAVQVWTYAPCIQRATQAEAENYLDHYALAMEDSESLDAWTAGLVAQTQIIGPGQVAAFRKRFAAGAGGTILVGTAARIADRMTAMAEAGLDGILLTWVDFADGIARFADGVLPLLERRGLRSAGH